MVRSVHELVDTYKSTLESYQTYYAKVDPIYRSMFRVRDCMVDSFLIADFNQLSASRHDFSSELIQAGLDHAAQALKTNSELKARLHKKYTIIRSADAQEKYMMSRLKTAHSSTLGIDIPVDEEKDSVLDASVISPTEWDAKAATYLQQVDSMEADKIRAERGMLKGGRQKAMLPRERMQ
eukprot:TRINITY_DN18476_c0_g1_i3.p1 TRINITY_DN18476_c0_g1~~TRINITY_DN18476_c0_g1_i3.p1  ORF type:complete len:180 (+),score=33.28 TRINITY_DN18476_c0_g1_i3:256-795(+)